MTADSRPDPPDRFAPRAHREMAGMFDGVSSRYDLLNRLMTLNQDRLWRQAMWREVPEDARVVLDLCTGNGASLPGLRRPGRTVLGMDVSFGMLEAATEYRSPGWGPRLVCADAFRLPLRSGAVHAITMAFGVRNLRPRPQALAEVARVLAPGGSLVVLEATAPAPGPLAGAQRFYVRHIVPLLGRLSPDPSAYAYLSRSIFEFGAGPEFERDLGAAGLTIVRRRAFLFGSTRLWTVQRSAAAGPIAANRPPAVQPAMGVGDFTVRPDPTAAARDAEWRTWALVHLVVAAALTASLIWILWVLAKSGADLPLAPWQRRVAWALAIFGILVFGARTGRLAFRAFGPAPRRQS
jgi:demethylmenaquinone methyltransferase/2-methoxy-6-polyprenyl-1,4-benzoquinol methylase